MLPQTVKFSETSGLKVRPARSPLRQPNISSQGNVRSKGSPYKVLVPSSLVTPNLQLSLFCRAPNKLSQLLRKENSFLGT